MKSNSGKFVRTLMLALGLFLALPMFAVSTSAQTGWWGNGQQRRDRDRDNDGIDDRVERRQRRQQRREARRDRRDDRRNDGYYGNNGVYNNGGYNNDNYGNYGGSYQLRQTALNAGYNNGMEEGRRDRQRNERFNYTDEGDYQSASKDYSSRMGDRGAYQRYFREAFARGYRDGYGNNNGYNNDGYYRGY